MAQIDPTRALSWFGELDSDALAPSGTGFPGSGMAAMVARNVFDAMVRLDGTSAMPKILTTANILGDKGRYPFSGVMAAAIATKNDGVIEATARQLFRRYQPRLDPATSGLDFADMLRDSERHWLKELLMPTVELAVKGIQDYLVNDKDKNFDGTMHSPKGTAAARGPIETSLLPTAPIVKRVEPQLWKELLKQYSNLSGVPDAGMNFPNTSMTFTASPVKSARVLTPEQQKQQILNEVYQRVGANPEKASQTISTITNPALRAEALSKAAQMLAQRNPKESAQLAAESQQLTAKIEDPVIRFQSACAKKNSDAVNKNQAALPDDLDTAFQLAYRGLRKTRNDEKDTGYLIGPLVDAVNQAMKLEPELTVAHIDSPYLPFEKAQLLVSAASAPAPPVRPIQPNPPPQSDRAEKQAK